MGNLKKKHIKETKKDSIKVAFKKLSQKDHDKYRVPVYSYLVP